VAKRAYRGMDAGQAVITPGILNKVYFGGVLPWSPPATVGLLSQVSAFVYVCVCECNYSLLGFYGVYQTSSYMYYVGATKPCVCIRSISVN
jgi:hypothetical protein